jgi:hypothetical protein
MIKKVLHHKIMWRLKWKKYLWTHNIKQTWTNWKT